MSLVELMIAVALVAIFIVPMSELLFSMNRSVQKVPVYEWYDKFISVDDSLRSFASTEDSLGKKSCRYFNAAAQGGSGVSVHVPIFQPGSAGQTLAQVLGTSSLPTSITVLGNYILMGTNSSSTTLPDFIVMKKQPSGAGSTGEPVLYVVATLDTGPGVADMAVTGTAAYVADTSANYQATALSLADPEHPAILRKFVIPGANSATSPIAKRLITYGPFLILGTEKSTLPEVAVFNSVTGAFVASINTEFGINRLFAAHQKFFVLGPSNPELDVYNTSSTPSGGLSLLYAGSYDAPGGSGNGRSIDIFGNTLVFGRSKGGNELELLSFSAIDTAGAGQWNATASLKLSASIDNVIADKEQVFVFTSDPLRELMIFKPELNSEGFTNLRKIADVDLPARTASAVCDGPVLYVALQSNEVPLVAIY